MCIRPAIRQTVFVARKLCCLSFWLSTFWPTLGHFVGGPPGEMPLATDNTDTLPVDICLTATPPSAEGPLSPNHCPDAKRQCFQQTRKEKKDVETEKVSKKEAEEARQPEANVMQNDEKTEKKTKPKGTKENEFSTSDAEVRVAVRVLTNIFLQKKHVGVCLDIGINQLG